jgi:HEAT repeat protein
VALHSPPRPAGPGAPAGATTTAALRAAWLPRWGAGASVEANPSRLDALAEARTPLAMCKALGGLGFAAGDGGAAARAVRRMLDDRPKQEVRECAVAALARLGGPEARDVLDGLRSDGNRTVRLAALAALAESVEPGALELVARQSQDRDPERRHEALVALGRAGRGEVVPRLVEAIEQVGGSARAELVDALGGAGDDAVEPLVRLLSHPSTQVQASAAQALSQVGGPDAVRALVRVLFDGTAGSYGERRIVALLVDLGDEGRRALREVAESGAPDVRRAAQQALLGAGDEITRERLEGWLVSGKGDDVGLALRYLHAHAGEVPLPGGLVALARARPDQAHIVVDILGATGGEAARAALRGLAEAGGATGALALRELGSLPGEADWVRTRLTRALRDEGGRAAMVALEALADDGGPEARAALIEAGRGKGPLADQALNALANFADAEASRALVEAARGDSPRSRSTALRVLASRPDATSKAALLSVIDGWQAPDAELPHPGTVANVCAALIKQGAPEGERLLRRLADSKDERNWSAVSAAMAGGNHDISLPVDLTEKLARDAERPYAENALRLLADHEPGRARAIVEDMARSDNTNTRLYAVRTASLLPERERARLLEGALLDRDGLVASAAIREYAGEGGSDAQAALVGLLSRGTASPDVLGDAARLLRELGGEAARRHRDLIDRHADPSADDIDGGGEEMGEGD